MDQLLALTDIFLTSSVILIGGFTIARTEPLKTGLSLLGTAVTALWLICNYDAYSTGGDSTRALIIAYVLPGLFFLCWGLAGFVHARRWWELLRDAAKRSSRP
jgi:hypothetical protein